MFFPWTLCHKLWTQCFFTLNALYIEFPKSKDIIIITIMYLTKEISWTVLISDLQTMLKCHQLFQYVLYCTRKCFPGPGCYILTSLVACNLQQFLNLSASCPWTLQKWVQAFWGLLCGLCSSVWVYLMFFMVKCRLCIFGMNASEEMVCPFQNGMSGGKWYQYSLLDCYIIQLLIRYNHLFWC